MDIEYSTNKVEKLCTKLIAAKKKLGDREARELFALIQAIKAAKNLNDVKVFKKYRVHALENKNHSNRIGQVSCSIPSSGYRLILTPLDSDGIEWNGEDERIMYSTYYMVRIRKVEDYHD